MAKSAFFRSVCITFAKRKQYTLYYILKFRMLSRYKKIEVDSRFSAAEDRGHYSVCGNSAAKQTSFISF